MSTIYLGILHIYFGGYDELVSTKKACNTFCTFTNRLVYIFNYIKQVSKSTISYKLHSFHRKKIRKKIWFIANTLNQRAALEPIQEKFEGSIWISRSYKKSIHLVDFRRIFYFLKYSKIVKTLRKIHPQKTEKFHLEVFKASGEYEFYLYMLKKYSPELIVVSSDHSKMNRSIIYAAKTLGIPSIYIQHASVSKYFPNLEADLNLLEGRHAFDQYKRCGPINGKVMLIGMPKFDQYLKYRSEKKTIDKIAFCLNPQDDLKIVDEAINYIITWFPNSEINIRKHPRDKRKVWFDMKDINYSQPELESTFEFLKNQDLVIAGESSIHLEATLLNIPAVQYAFSKNEKLNDYYGYVKNKMIYKAHDLAGLRDYIQSSIQSRKDVFQKAAYYNQSINSHNFSSSDLAFKYITEYIN